MKYLIGYEPVNGMPERGKIKWVAATHILDDLFIPVDEELGVRFNTGKERPNHWYVDLSQDEPFLVKEDATALMAEYANVRPIALIKSNVTDPMVCLDKYDDRIVVRAADEYKNTAKYCGTVRIILSRTTNVATSFDMHYIRSNELEEGYEIQVSGPYHVWGSTNVERYGLKDMVNAND